MSARECTVTNCGVAADFVIEGRQVCGVCTDLYLRCGHWPDAALATVRECPFCSELTKPTRSSAVTDGGVP